MELDLPAFPRMMFGKGNHAEMVHQSALGITLTFLNAHLPSGKHTKNYRKSPCYQWENPLFLWPFSIANC
jgi:hypothetical protein